MKECRRTCRAGMVTVTLLMGSAAVWLLHSPRVWELVERAVVLRFNFLNPQHWLQLLLYVK